MPTRPKSPRFAQCTVCRHPDRARIESLRVGGASLEALAREFGVSKDALHRHHHNHVSDKRRAQLMAGPAKAEELANLAADESRSLLDYLRIVRSVTFSTFLAAAEAGDRTGVAHVGGKLLEVLDRLGKLSGELRELGGLTIRQLNVFSNDPRFLQLQRGLVAIARAHPAARADIIALLRRLDEDQPALVPVNDSAPPQIEAETDAT